MFDFDSGVESLELGSRRRPVKWAVELSLADCRPQKHKARKRQEAAQGGVSSQEVRQHALLQQQAQQLKVAAQRKHLEELSQQQQQDPADVTPAQAKYRKEFRDSSVVCLSTEIEQGNVEYKYRLTGCATNENRRHQLVTQMKFRLSEGSGECFYYLGVEDDGYPRGLEPQELQDSIAVIHHMAVSLQATARLVEYVPGGFGRTAALMHIKANAEEDMRATDSRVAVAGSMDSGKSTLVAVLTHGADGRPLLDNGRGSARMAVFRHKHEIESGRTSSISQQVLGYDEEGRVLNYVGVATPTPADVTAAASHIVNFIDIGGHEKYMKTTLYGMTCLLPDYALLCVDAATGITRITREHLAVAVALEIPTALVVTKADAVDELQLQAVLQQLYQLMQPVLHTCQTPADVVQEQQHAELEQERQPPQLQQVSIAGCTSSITRSSSSGGDRQDELFVGAAAAAYGGSPRACVGPGVPLVSSEAQAIALAASLSELHSCTAAPAAPSFQQAVFPVFVVSCVSGAGTPLLHAFLSHLKPLQEHKQPIGSTPTHDSSSITAAGGGQVADGDADGSSSATAGAGKLPNIRDGSSQLWGVSSKKHLPAADASAVLERLPTTSAAKPSLTAAAAPAAAAAAGGGAEGASSSAAGGGAEGTSAAAAGSLEAEEEVPGHFQVVHTYDVEGVGWVVSGIAVTGTIEVGQSLLWGPTPEGGFSPVRITCIQRSHIAVRQISPGQTATLALHPTATGLPHSGSKQALLTAAAVAQAAAAEAAAREAAAAIAAVPEPIAKTRRRSPAALQAAAAAAASTAATAAAAVDAARRAAEIAAGKAWWLQEQADVADVGGVCGGDSFRTAAAGSRSEQGSTPARVLQAGAASGIGNNAADSLADLLDDDGFAAELAAANSCSDSDADVFGRSSGDRHSHLGGHSARSSAHGSPDPGAAAAAGRGAAAAANHADGDLFAGLADVFGDDDDECDGGFGDGAYEQPGPARNSTSSSAASSITTSSSGGLVESWSFSSASSRERQPAAGRDCAAPPAAAAASEPVSITAGAHPHSRSGGLLSGPRLSSSEQLLGCSPSRWRTKGGVLLHAAAAPHTYWEFEALLVLLGGFWPPRGLLSGSWPPGQDTPAPPAVAAGSSTQDDCTTEAAAAGSDGVSGVLAQPSSSIPGDQQGQQEVDGQQRVAHDSRGRGKQRRGSKQFEFAYVVHCNSVRQVARVVSMQELREHTPAADDGDTAARDGQQPGSSSSGACNTTPGFDAGVQQQPHQHYQQQQHCGLTASIRAAAALLQGGASSHASDKEGGSSDCASGDSSGEGSRRQRRLGGGSSVRRPSAAGSVVVVRFRFTHRPEWLQVGARLIARDRSDGHVAAAGFVTKLREPHTQLQQHQRELQKGKGKGSGC